MQSGRQKRTADRAPRLGSGASVDRSRSAEGSSKWVLGATNARVQATHIAFQDPNVLAAGLLSSADQQPQIWHHRLFQITAPQHIAAKEVGRTCAPAVGSGSPGARRLHMSGIAPHDSARLRSWACTGRIGRKERCAEPARGKGCPARPRPEGGGAGSGPPLTTRSARTAALDILRPDVGMGGLRGLEGWERVSTGRGGERRGAARGWPPRLRLLPHPLCCCVAAGGCAASCCATADMAAMVSRARLLRAVHRSWETIGRPKSRGQVQLRSRVASLRKLGRAARSCQPAAGEQIQAARLLGALNSLPAGCVLQPRCGPCGAAARGRVGGGSEGRAPPATYRIAR